MSRVASNPILLPDGVEIKVEGKRVTASGKIGELSYEVHELVRLVDEESGITFTPEDESKEANALAGTMRALLHNMVIGVSEGFQKKLELQGVGYRAQASGKKLTLQLGFSHPVEYEVPEGIWQSMMIKVLIMCKFVLVIRIIGKLQLYPLEE